MVLTAGLAGCAPPDPEGAAADLLGRIHHELPVAGDWLAEASIGASAAASVDTDGSLLLGRPSPAAPMGAFRSPPRQAVFARLPVDSVQATTFGLQPDGRADMAGAPREVRVRRSGPGLSAPALLDGIAVGAAGDTATGTLWFTRGTDIEELLFVEGEGEEIAYEIQVPEGSRLHQPVPWMIEVREGRHAWLRMRFDHAFAPEGVEPHVEVTLRGDHQVRVRVESPAWPVLVDPLWQSASSMTEARVEARAVRLDTGEVLVAGGMQHTGAGPTDGYLGTAEVFDAGTNSFTTVPMTQPRHGHTATLTAGGEVLVAGSDKNTPGYFNTAELFDPVTMTFSPTGLLGTERAYHTATALKNKGVLIIGGNGEQPAELYVPSGQFFPVGTPLSCGRQWHTATLLPDGRVFVAGGKSCSGDQGVRTTEIYDPQTESFTAGPELAMERRSHRATLLPSGEVLLTGGLESEPGAALDSMEIVNPNGGSRLLTARMNVPRFLHVAEPLPDGRVLLAGGSVAFKEAEIFDPETETLVPAPPTLVPHPRTTSAPIGLGPVAVFGGGVADVLARSEVEIFIPGAQGQACESDDECESGFCRDKVCCESDCSGTCRACSRAMKGQGEEGVCELVRAGADPHLDCLVGKVDGSASCPNNGFCTAQGICELPCDQDGGRACRPPDRCETLECRSSVDCLSGYRCSAERACVLVDPRDLPPVAAAAACSLPRTGRGGGPGVAGILASAAAILSALRAARRRDVGRTTSIAGVFKRCANGAHHRT